MEKEMDAMNPLYERQRQQYQIARHHGHPVQPGGQAGIQPVRYRCVGGSG